MGISSSKASVVALDQQSLQSPAIHQRAPQSHSKSKHHVEQPAVACPVRRLVDQLPNHGIDSKELDQAQILMMKQALSIPKNDAQVPPELVAAAGAAAKDYSRYKMRKHHHKMGNLQKGLKLQQAAIEALPEHLAKAATEIDWNPFDMTRLLPTWTPPIKGWKTTKSK